MITANDDRQLQAYAFQVDNGVVDLFEVGESIAFFNGLEYRESGMNADEVFDFVLSFLRSAYPTMSWSRGEVLDGTGIDDPRLVGIYPGAKPEDFIDHVIDLRSTDDFVNDLGSMAVGDSSWMLLDSFLVRFTYSGLVNGSRSYKLEMSSPDAGTQWLYNTMIDYSDIQSLDTWCQETVVPTPWSNSGIFADFLNVFNTAGYILDGRATGTGLLGLPSVAYSS